MGCGSGKDCRAPDALGEKEGSQETGRGWEQGKQTDRAWSSKDRSMRHTESPETALPQSIGHEEYRGHGMG